MLRIDNLSLRHGSQILFVDASLTVFRGEKVGLVGPNGAGKSTVFRLIMGEDEPDAGQVIVEKRTVIGHFSQQVGEMSGRSVLEEVMAGAGEVSDVRHELHALELALADPDQADQLDTLIERFGEVQARFDDLDGYALEARAREILAGLSFRPDAVDGDVGRLSGGWKMRVALARILLMRPDLLLLDEPTNHLDIESIVWLERFLRDFDGAVVLVSHDREFMNRLVTKIVEIDEGALNSCTGDYDFYERQRALADQHQEAQHARQQAMLAKEEAFIARFKARASHASQVQSRVKKLDKIDKIEPPRRRKVIKMELRQPPRSGDDVVKLTGVHKAYGPLVIYDGLDFLVRRRERWCVMGVNGAGKSTLLKMIAGASAPDAGTVDIGASVRMGYFAQHAMEILKPTLTVLETLESAYPTANGTALRTYLGTFGFSGDDVDKRVDILSGGEKARVVLAEMLYDPPNLLVLDEPTNHLDLDTKARLVEALADFEGTLVFVSHDRHFLRAVSTRVLELGPEGPHVYPGTYPEYIAATGHEAPGVN
ncbi:MAG: ABC-F family ATP-binding cassette domain-containing protein [Deltaproteobacteria bacterium]|nr:MAG: ABC-F family ATP-binding cassette domain-containing protein [Deltaproteobacteria bacterium]